jgi:hypothetical protein
MSQINIDIAKVVFNGVNTGLRWMRRKTGFRLKQVDLRFS